MVEVFHSFQNICCVFTGQSEDCMHDYFDIFFSQAFYGIIKNAERISPSDIPGSGLMDRLKSKFDPDRFLFI